MDLQFEKDPPSPRPGYSDMTTLTEVCCDKNKAAAAPRKPPRTFLVEGGSSGRQNVSLESIDEMASLRNVGDSCYNSHHQHLAGFVRSKSLSPHAPHSPTGYHASDFVSEEFYIDESLPSSLSIEQAAGEIALQLSNANDVVALLQVLPLSQTDTLSLIYTARLFLRF